MPYWDGYPFHETTPGNRIRLKKALEEGKSFSGKLCHIIMCHSNQLVLYFVAFTKAVS